MIQQPDSPKATPPRSTFILLRFLGIFTLLFAFLGWGWWLFTGTPQQVAARASLLEQIFSIGNYLEAGFWMTLAIGFVVKAGQESAPKRWCHQWATLTFCLFGLSDLVEVHTRGWWKPWWLFLWKATCVGSMILLLGNYLYRKRIRKG